MEDPGGSPCRGAGCHVRGDGAEGKEPCGKGLLAASCDYLAIAAGRARAGGGGDGAESRWRQGCARGSRGRGGPCGVPMETGRGTGAPPRGASPSPSCPQLPPGLSRAAGSPGSFCSSRGTGMSQRRALHPSLPVPTEDDALVHRQSLFQAFSTLPCSRSGAQPPPQGAHYLLSHRRPCAWCWGGGGREKRRGDRPPSPHSTAASSAAAALSSPGTPSGCVSRGRPRESALPPCSRPDPCPGGCRPPAVLVPRARGHRQGAAAGWRRVWGSSGPRNPLPSR